MPRDLLPIGSFATRCRLSVKALRHYDELGLLRPQHVDLISGYRYYDRRQASAAIAIALLRSLDVPLATIRELLAGEDPEAISRVLARERARRAREIAEAESALRSIERLMRAGTVFPYDIELREEPARTVLVHEGTTTTDLHIAFGESLVRELIALLASFGRQQTGPVFCVIPPAPEDMVTLRMCTVITEPPPGAPVVVLPAVTVAATRHIGPYEEIGLAEHAVRAWAEENALEPAGDIREVYRNDPAEVSPDELETEVLLPVILPSDRTRGTAEARR